MLKKSFVTAAAGLLGVLATSSVSATSFTATGTGPITAYFYGQSAGFGSDIGLWVNGVFQGVYGLQNHSVAAGTSLVLGNANAGDTLVFELRVSTSNGLGPNPWDYSLFSTPSLNSDGQEHTVASAFAGGPFGIPAGTMVGFEDILPLANSDHDYDDHLFVFTGVTNHGVPEGGMTLGLMSLAIGGLGLLRRKA